MSDETDFSPSPGDVVLDCDDDDPDRAVVVNTPQIRAEDWMIVRFEKTVAEDNPEYPPDALVAVVMYEAYIEEYADTMPDWDRTHALSLTALNDKELNYYVFPYPRLAPAELESETETESHPESEPPESDESSVDHPAHPALTDITHVGESRAEDLRAAGYVTVADVATADQSGLTAVDGIGGTRAAQLSAHASDLLDEQSDGSEADAPDETDTDTPESRETTEADTDPSAAIVALSQYLESDGMEATITDDGESVRVTNAEHSYRVSLDEGVGGDGPHRSQLEEAVEKARAATQATNE